MNEELIGVQVNYEEAEELADFSSIFIDLAFVRETLKESEFHWE